MFETGQKIGPYQLERALGEGSYGVVWLAEERTGLIQRHVALKLPKEADPDIHAIRREAETWLRAGKHHNVVQVLNADIYDGQVAIATEYIAGGSLHDRLRRPDRAPYGIEDSVRMTCGILAGLQHLHGLAPKPIVHRDLKPGNILLNAETPLLTDFGLSRVFSSTTFTQAGGTPAYMPPEAFDDRFSPQTDIWAVGVILYRLVAGALPFPQRELSALIGAILRKEPGPLPPTVPVTVTQAIFKSLQKDPGQRFTSAEEMRVTLDRALSSAECSSCRPDPVIGYMPRTATAPGPPEFDISFTKTVLTDVRPPQVPALTATNRPLARYSEELTAVPERPAGERNLSTRVDDLVRYVSRDTTRFCGALLASLPVWAVLAGFNRLLEQSVIAETIPAMFLMAGFMSVLFARLAWHRYYWRPIKSRRRTAVSYAVLGLASGAVIPVIAVAFAVAVAGATGAPSETPQSEQAQPEIPHPDQIPK